MKKKKVSFDWGDDKQCVRFIETNNFLVCF